MTELLIATRVGHLLDLLDLESEDIEPEDIAHSLSLQCRWVGHTRAFYSVAQHCVSCCSVAEGSDLELDVQKWALLHDAAEAYIGDINAPLKRHIPFLHTLEEVILRRIAERFDLKPDLPPPVVELIDKRLLATEWYQLMHSCAIQGTWNPGAEPFDFHLDPMPWVRAKAAWVAQFNRLFDEELRVDGPNNSDG